MKIQLARLSRMARTWQEQMQRAIASADMPDADTSIERVSSRGGNTAEASKYEQTMAEMDDRAEDRDAIKQYEEYIRQHPEQLEQREAEIAEAQAEAAWETDERAWEADERARDHAQAHTIARLIDEGLPVTEPVRVYDGDEISILLAEMDLEDAVTGPVPLTSETVETPLESAFLGWVTEHTYPGTSQVPTPAEFPADYRDQFARSFAYQEHWSREDAVRHAEDVDVAEDEL